MAKDKVLIIRINEKFYKYFIKYCTNHNKTMSEVLTSYIREHNNSNNIVLFNNNQDRFIKMVDYNLRRVGNNLNQAVAGLNSLVKYLEQGFDDNHTAKVIESVNTSIQETNILLENIYYQLLVVITLQDNNKFLHIRINNKILDKFKENCKNHDRTMSEVLRFDVINCNSANNNLYFLFSDNEKKLKILILNNIRRIGNNLNQAISNIQILRNYIENLDINQYLETRKSIYNFWKYKKTNKIHDIRIKEKLLKLAKSNCIIGINKNYAEYMQND